MRKTVIKNNPMFDGTREIKIKKVPTGFAHEKLISKVVITNLDTLGNDYYNSVIHSAIPVPITEGNAESRRFFDLTIHNVWREYDKNTIIWPLPKGYILSLNNI